MPKWLIDDDMSRCTAEEVARLLPLVSEQRREKALRYKHVFGQYCCLRAWLMLRELLNGLGMDEEWQYNEHGKPFLPNGPFFSISHCKEAIAVAVDEQPIGIDIEHIHRFEPELIARTMSAREREHIRDARDFTRLWTQKEAVVKAQGVGICSFEQLQHVLENPDYSVQTVEKEKYIYSIVCTSTNGK